jgi:DNA polymerase III delta subunit
MPRNEEVNVCLLRGNYFERKETLSKILTQFDPQDIYAFDGTEAWDYVRGEIISIPMFNERRMFIMSSWPQFKSTQSKGMKEVTDTINHVSSDCLLVFNNLEGTGKNYQEFVKEVKKSGKVIDFDQSIRYSSAAGWIEAHLEIHGKNIEGREALMLVESIGETNTSKHTIDLELLILLCRKLMHFIGRRKNITTDDVVAVCIDSSQFIIWRLFEALDGKYHCQANDLVQRHLQSEKNINSAISSILHMALWRYKLLLFIKEGIADGWDQNQVFDEIAKLHKTRQEENKDNPEKIEEAKPLYSQGMVKSMLGLTGYSGKPPITCYSRRDLYVIVNAVQQAMMRMRENLTESEMFILVDTVIMAACNISDSGLLRDIRGSRYG